MLGFIALAAFALVLAAAAIGFAAVGVGLITKTSLYGVIPAMPYGSALRQIVNEVQHRKRKKLPVGFSSRGIFWGES